MEIVVVISVFFFFYTDYHINTKVMMFLFDKNKKFCVKCFSVFLFVLSVNLTYCVSHTGCLSLEWAELIYLCSLWSVHHLLLLKYLIICKNKYSQLIIVTNDWEKDKCHTSLCCKVRSTCVSDNVCTSDRTVCQRLVSCGNATVTCVLFSLQH